MESGYCRERLTAVEQLLVRVLRQPETRRRQNLALNQSYTFVVSRDFSETARTLRDRLVEGAGFERREAAEFVTAAKKEEFDCAVWLDRQAQQGRIEF